MINTIAVFVYIFLVHSKLLSALFFYSIIIDNIPTQCEKNAYKNGRLNEIKKHPRTIIWLIENHKFHYLLDFVIIILQAILVLYLSSLLNLLHTNKNTTWIWFSKVKQIMLHTLWYTILWCWIQNSYCIFTRTQNYVAFWNSHPYFYLLIF